MNQTHLVTHLLDAVGRGDEVAREQLLDAVYAELRQMASAALARESGMRTLQPTALVHEAYLRLFGASPARSTASPTTDAGDGQFHNRRHFFAAAAEAMRRILVDGARKRGRKKRGQGAKAQSLHGGPVMDEASAAVANAQWIDVDEILDIDAALDRLAEVHPREAEVVKLRYFAGLTVEDVAATLGIATRTVEKDWSFARAWLKRALTGMNDE